VTSWGEPRVFRVGTRAFSPAPEFFAAKKRKKRSASEALETPIGARTASSAGGHSCAFLRPLIPGFVCVCDDALGLAGVAVQSNPLSWLTYRWPTDRDLPSRSRSRNVHVPADLP
jgi:hypothetical protein